jgi:hypothetical protein
MFKYEKDEKIRNEAVRKCIIKESRESEKDLEKFVKKLNNLVGGSKSMIIIDRYFPHVVKLVDRKWNGRGTRYWLSDGSDIFIAWDAYVEHKVEGRKHFFFITSEGRGHASLIFIL